MSNHHLMFKILQFIQKHPRCNIVSLKGYDQNTIDAYIDQLVQEDYLFALVSVPALQAHSVLTVTAKGIDYIANYKPWKQKAIEWLNALAKYSDVLRLMK